MREGSKNEIDVMMLVLKPRQFSLYCRPLKEGGKKGEGSSHRGIKQAHVEAEREEKGKEKKEKERENDQ